MVEDTTLAWLAALIDGEGSVMLLRRVPSATAKVQRNPHYRAQVCVYNTDYRLMQALSKRTGISRVYEHTRPAKENRKKTSYRWGMVSEEIRQWGPLLLPWLVCKAEQTALLLEALDIKEQITPGNPGFLPQNRPEFVGRLDQIYAEIRRLNTRGRETAEGG